MPDSALSQSAGGSGIDMLTPSGGGGGGQGTASIDAGQLATDVSLADTGLPAELQLETGAGAAGGAGAGGGAGAEPEEQPRRPTTPGGRRRVDDHAVQKSKQDMQNCFGFDVSRGGGGGGGGTRGWLVGGGGGGGRRDVLLAIGSAGQAGSLGVKNE